MVLCERADRCGRKLAVSGRSRANLSHACTPQEMAERFDADSAALLPLLSRFPHQRVVRFFESVGVGCRTDAQGRVWPRGMGAPAVSDALVRAAVAGGVDVRNGAILTGLEPTGGGWRVRTTAGELTAENVCLATGGASQPGAEATDNVPALCRELGLATVDWFPALCSLAVDDGNEPLAGVAMPDVGLALSVDDEERRSTRGQLMFSRRFVTGSGVLNLSGYAARALAQGGEPVLRVDWLPSLVAERVMAELAEAVRLRKRARVGNWLVRWLSRRLSAWLLARAGVPLETTIAGLSADQQAVLVGQLKSTSFMVVGSESIERATVSGGGVSLDEISIDTCEAHRLAGLHITGELLDTWAETGGYNLHFAWATGIAAAEHVAGRELQ